MNYNLFRSINNLSGNHTLDSLMRPAAKDVIYLVIVVLVGVCLYRLSRRVIRPVVATAAGLVLTFLLGLLGAALHRERRPFQSHKVHQLVAHAGGQSFPSDHATAAFGIALAVGVFLSWRWGVVLFALALLVGFARVYDGIHYPGDIAGSFLAALVGVGLVALVVQRVGRGGHDRSRRTAAA